MVYMFVQQKIRSEKEDRSLTKSLSSVSIFPDFPISTCVFEVSLIFVPVYTFIATHFCNDIIEPILFYFSVFAS